MRSNLGFDARNANIRLAIDNTGGGSGEPPDGAMEVRIDRLEEDVRELRVDMKDVRERLPRIEEQIKALPAKDYIVKVVVGLGAFITVALAIQGAVQSFLGIAAG